MTGGLSVTEYTVDFWTLGCGLAITVPQPQYVFLVRRRQQHSFITTSHKGMTALSTCWTGCLCRLGSYTASPIQSVWQWSSTSWTLSLLTVSHCRAGFLFVTKMDKTLPPYLIDFQGLNAIMVRNWYLLLLISSAQEPLHRAWILTTLDLQNTYHFLRGTLIPLTKWWWRLSTPFMVTSSTSPCLSASKTHQLCSRPSLMMCSGTSWIICFCLSGQYITTIHFFQEPRGAHNPRPSGAFLPFARWQCEGRPREGQIGGWVEELQRFLGFVSKFYCRLIRDYSKVASPLTRLTSTSVLVCHPGWTTQSHSGAGHLDEQLWTGKPRSFWRPAPPAWPLTIPGRPWSHIAFDFVTSLPLSDGNTVVLTVVDWFSKAAHLIALPKLLSALEMLWPCLQAAWLSFRHGDSGFHFVSRVWFAFAESLGSSVSPTSSYHP